MGPSSSFLLFLAFSNLALAADVPDYEKLKKAELEREKAWHSKILESRKQVMDGLVLQRKAVSDALAKTSRTSQYPQWLKLRSQLDAVNNRITATAQSQNVPLPRLASRLEDMKEGAMARLTVDNTGEADDYPLMRIRQIKDAKSAIVTWGRESFWIEMDTKGLVDGADLHVSNFVYHHGTKKIIIGGSSRTVFHLVIVK